MANIAWRVKFGTAAATPSGGTVLNDIQNVSIQAGRDWLTDPYSPASCTITSRNISAWTTAPKVGDPIVVQASSDTAVYPFGGLIKDVKINYGNLPSMDSATITCEGPFAYWGRRQFNALVITQDTTQKQIDAIALPTALWNTTAPTSQKATSIASAQTYTGNGADLFNELIQTEVGHMYETTALTTWVGPTTYNSYVVFLKRNADVTADYTFSDNPASTSEMYFESIEFTSAMQNYYNSVTIEPLGLASQTSDQSVSNVYSLTQSSLDYSTSQALSHAQYLVSQFNTTTSKPVSMSATYANQGTNSTRQNTFRSFCHATARGSGQLIKIVFRSNTYYAIIEGSSIGIDPADTLVNLTLSAQDNNNYLTLNNAVFGTLDSNKLGF